MKTLYLKISLDGNDNVWVANFDGQLLSQLCGPRGEGACPPGKATGDPISPDGGYDFDGLVRNTWVQIDPSVNVWLANNWETVLVPT
ncbi:MAG: hypothetical protein JRJ15_11715, partial [Deltaproteobacteria bacterium]|nr:hypothetical protein [Deltaproteobacteria bacterium]